MIAETLHATGKALWFALHRDQTAAGKQSRDRMEHAHPGEIVVELSLGRPHVGVLVQIRKMGTTDEEVVVIWDGVENVWTNAVWIAIPGSTGPLRYSGGGLLVRECAIESCPYCARRMP